VTGAADGGGGSQPGGFQSLLAQHRSFPAAPLAARLACALRWDRLQLHIPHTRPASRLHAGRMYLRRGGRPVGRESGRPGGAEGARNRCSGSRPSEVAGHVRRQAAERPAVLVQYPRPAGAASCPQRERGQPARCDRACSPSRPRTAAMTGSDLIVAAPWIIFGAGIAVIRLRLAAGKRARRTAVRPPPRTDAEAGHDVTDGPARKAPAGERHRAVSCGRRPSRGWPRSSSSSSRQGRASRRVRRPPPPFWIP
jgi:hypothetical protein